MTEHFTLDGQPVPFEPGQTVMQAAQAAGHYIPHLCWHPDFAAHGSCKLCTVQVGPAESQRFATGCTTAAAPGLQVHNHTPALAEKRRTLLQMLFVEGNHFCPSCEKSGHCVLQATAYEMGMQGPHFDHFFPNRTVDASHPDMWLDLDRCIQCELCVRASRDVDGKNVFALSGRGTQSHLVVNSESGRLADTNFAATDRAAHVCPVGAILPKRVGFATPIGQRPYDVHRISEAAPASAHGQEEGA